MPQMIQTQELLRIALTTYRRDGKRIGFVPTMGALHEGHVSLVKRAKQQCDIVVVSIFVNPMQFGANEDLDRYPKRLEKDKSLLEEQGVDVLFVPTVEEMYPDHFSTTVTVSGVSEGLCGAMRPRHFAGVATVVTKLFMQVLPDLAFFGEKDYQQLKVIERMVADLSIPVQIVGVPTGRSADGLALSSRNQYLSPKEREIAPLLYKYLNQAANKIAGGLDVGHTLDWAKQALLDGGFNKIDYMELREAAHLEPLTRFEPPARLLAAAWLGTTRLIDNVPVDR